MMVVAAAALVEADGAAVVDVAEAVASAMRVSNTSFHAA